MQSYIYWALLGMVGYFLTTLFTKLAEQSGDILGGSLLGVLFLGEPMTWNKIVGLAAAAIRVVLISI